MKYYWVEVLLAAIILGQYIYHITKTKKRHD